MTPDEYLSARTLALIRRRRSKNKRRSIRKTPTNPTALRPRVLLGDEPWSCTFCQECIEWAAANQGE